MWKLSVFVVVILVFVADAGKGKQPEFKPPPGEIKIVEGENLDLEITRIDDGYCIYTSGKGHAYNCSYEVDSWSSGKGDCSKNVEFDYSGCAITIRHFDETYPREWTLSSDKSPDYHFTITTNFFHKPQLLMDAIEIPEGNGFIQYMKISSNKTITKCSAGYGDKMFDLDLHSKSQPKGEDLDEDLMKRIRSLGDGICGFSVSQTNRSDPTEWSMEAFDSENEPYLGHFELELEEVETNNKEMQVYFGDKVTIPCGDTYYDEFCALYSPAGEQVHSDGDACDYTINTIQLSDLGVWRCLTSDEYELTIENIVNVTVKEDLYINTWIEERDDNVRIGCQVVNHPKLQPSFCMMTDPTGAMHIIRTSTSTDRYTSLTTDLKNGTCGIEIYKPLLQHELGQWTCQLDDNLGGLINLGDPPTYPHHIAKTVQLDKSLTIRCQVPYSTNYCHITAPDDEVYKNDDEYKSRLGVCTTTIKKAELKHNGTWTCSFARDNGMPDEEVVTEVKVAEQLLTYNATSGNMSETVELMCQTGYPIKYCRFISPTGQSYHLSEMESNSSVAYRGRGLEHGDCGIAISNVTEEHAGNWTCMTRIGKSYDRPEIKADILVIVNEKSDVIVIVESSSVVGMAIGITVGILVLIAIVIALVYVIRRQNWLELSMKRVRFGRGSYASNSSNETAPPEYDVKERI